MNFKFINIVVTLSKPEQIGQDVYRQALVSRVFSTLQPISDMLTWAKSEGFTNPTINDLQFSEAKGV